MSDLSTICTVIVSFTLGFIVKYIFDFFVVNYKEDGQNILKEASGQLPETGEISSSLEKEQDLEGEDSLESVSEDTVDFEEDENLEETLNFLTRQRNTSFDVLKNTKFHEKINLDEDRLTQRNEEKFWREKQNELALSSTILANVNRKNQEKENFEIEALVKKNGIVEKNCFENCDGEFGESEKFSSGDNDLVEENLDSWDDEKQLQILMRQRNTSFDMTKQLYEINPSLTHTTAVFKKNNENNDEQEKNNLLETKLSSLIFANVSVHNQNMLQKNIKISKDVNLEKNSLSYHVDGDEKSINSSINDLTSRYDSPWSDTLQNLALKRNISCDFSELHHSFNLETTTKFVDEGKLYSNVDRKRSVEEDKSEKKSDYEERPQIIKLTLSSKGEIKEDFTKTSMALTRNATCAADEEMVSEPTLFELGNIAEMDQSRTRTPSLGWSEDSLSPRGDLGYSVTSSGCSPEVFTNSSCCTQIPPTQHNLQLQASPKQNVSSTQPAVSLMSRLSNGGGQLNAIPKRERTGEASQMNELSIEKLDESQVLSSSFWQPIIGNDLDRTLDFKPDELSYRFSCGKKINFDGFWNDPHNSHPPFKVEQRIVDYGNGQMECILFDFSLNEWVCDRTNSVTERKPLDRIVWHTDNSDENKVMIWERYTVLDATADTLLKQYRIRLPPLCEFLIKKFTGEKTWIPTKIRKKAFRESLFCEARCMQVKKVLKEMCLWSKQSTKKIEDVATKILQFDDSSLDVDSIGKLNGIIPDENEICMLASRTIEDLETMTDKCLKIFSEIPLVNKRFTAWLFTKHFDQTMQDMNSLMEILDATHKAIYHNKSLKLMFGLVLSVCNYMNEGSEFGSAYGFKLDSLEQLKKRRGNQESLLFYIVLIAYHKHPSALRFVHELSILSNASLTCENMIGLRSRIDSLHFEISRLQHLADDPETDEAFAEMLHRFLEIAQPLTDALEDRMSRVSGDFIALGRAFGENESDLNVLFFYYIETLNKFRINVQEVVTKIAETKEAQERKLQTKRQWSRRRKQRRDSASDSDYTSEEDAIPAEFIQIKKRLDKKRNNRVEHQKLSICKRLFVDGDASEIPSYEKLLLSFNEEQDREDCLFDNF